MQRDLIAGSFCRHLLLALVYGVLACVALTNAFHSSPHAAAWAIVRKAHANSRALGSLNMANSKTRGKVPSVDWSSYVSKPPQQTKLPRAEEKVDIVLAVDRLRTLGPGAWKTMSPDMKKGLISRLDTYLPYMSVALLLRVFTTLGMLGATKTDLQNFKVEKQFVRAIKQALPDFNIYSVCLTLEIFASLGYDWGRDLEASFEIARPLAAAMNKFHSYPKVYTPLFYLDAVRALNVQWHRDVLPNVDLEMSLDQSLRTHLHVMTPRDLLKTLSAMADMHMLWDRDINEYLNLGNELGTKISEYAPYMSVDDKSTLMHLLGRLQFKSTKLEDIKQVPITNVLQRMASELFSGETLRPKALALLVEGLGMMSFPAKALTEKLNLKDSVLLAGPKFLDAYGPQEVLSMAHGLSQMNMTYRTWFELNSTSLMNSLHRNILRVAPDLTLTETLKMLEAVETLHLGKTMSATAKEALRAGIRVRVGEQASNAVDLLVYVCAKELSWSTLDDFVPGLLDSIVPALTSGMSSLSPRDTARCFYALGALGLQWSDVENLGLGSLTGQLASNSPRFVTEDLTNIAAGVAVFGFIGAEGVSKAPTELEFLMYDSEVVTHLKTLSAQMERPRSVYDPQPCPPVHVSHILPKWNLIKFCYEEALGDDFLAPSMYRDLVEANLKHALLGVGAVGPEKKLWSSRQDNSPRKRSGKLVIPTL